MGGLGGILWDLPFLNGANLQKANVWEVFFVGVGGLGGWGVGGGGGGGGGP